MTNRLIVVESTVSLDDFTYLQDYQACRYQDHQDAPSVRQLEQTSLSLSGPEAMELLFHSFLHLHRNPHILVIVK